MHTLHDERWLTDTPQVRKALARKLLQFAKRRYLGTGDLRTRIIRRNTDGRSNTICCATIPPNEPAMQAILADPVQMLITTKSWPLLAMAHLARGAAAIGDGRHDDAFRHLWPVFDETDQ